MPPRHQEAYIPAYGIKPIEEIVSIAEDNIQQTWYAGDAYPWIFTNYGAGSVAAYVDLALIEYSENGGVWFRPGTDNEPLEEITISPRMDSEWFVHTDQYMRAICERIGHKTQITLPDLGGMLDILASVFTSEKLLKDMVDRPVEIARLLSETFAAWWRYYKHFVARINKHCPGCMSWAPVWSPQRTYMFQCDLSYMISPQMFKQFVVPELTRSCRCVDHAFYHLDGVGQLNHLDQLLDIPKLRGIQWVPGAGQKNPCQWPEVFDRILSKGKLIQTWAYEPAEVFQVIEHTHGAKGIIFEVQGIEEKDADRYVEAVHEAARRAG